MSTGDTMDSGQRRVTSSVQVWTATAASAAAGRDVDVWPVLVQTAVNIGNDNSNWLNNDDASTSIPLTADNYPYDDYDLTGQLQYQDDDNGHYDKYSQELKSTTGFRRDNKFTGEFGFYRATKRIENRVA